MALSSKLQLVYYLTIALTGFVGNTTTIIVFSQRRLRSLRSSFFLTCLAGTDLVFILILVVALLDELHAPVMTTPVCMLTIYLSHIASFLSSNFTLAYTTHRLIAVLFPIKATTFLKQRTNRILALTLFLFACVFYSISFPVTTTKFRSNSTNIVYCEEDRNKPLLFPFLVFDTLFTFILPFSLITFKYQPSVDHPVSVAQELVAENHVYGHDYILVAANIDKILSHKGKIRFTLHKVDGKGSSKRIFCSSISVKILQFF